MVLGAGFGRDAFFLFLVVSFFGYRDFFLRYSGFVYVGVYFVSWSVRVLIMFFVRVGGAEVYFGFYRVERG